MFTIVKKNMLVSFRNREFLVDIAVPITVALILALRKQLVALSQLMPILYCLSTSPTLRSIMIHLVEEKSKRYKETQKIMGLDSSQYTIGWIVTGYIRISLSISVFLLSSLLFNQIFDMDWDYYYQNGFGTMAWVYVLYGFAAMNQSFFFGAIFNEVKIAGEVQSFCCVALTFFTFVIMIEDAARSTFLYVFISLLSPQCCLAFSYIAAMKDNDVDNQSLIGKNLFNLKVIRETFNTNQAGYEMIALVFFYIMLFLYCDQVIPNEYGIAKHPLFFLQRGKSKVGTDDSSESLISQKDESSALYHEELKQKISPSILINNLRKVYNGNQVAVNNVKLLLYEQQIFCLLGHNGAGKTTMISMLTGMITKTEGTVYMNGLSLDKDLREIRKSLGLCTQKDCLYPELTVEEHLLFISGIKGQVDPDEIEKVMEQTELLNERNKQVNVLSGGSKRKLSLAMSLVGNSKIIFLDEPTSGMDAFSRRSIWDILEKIKNDRRTIILTTHHLDEAEILANRIGIMSKGELLAVGSSEFIKKKFGEGYNLRLTIQQYNNQKEQIQHKQDTILIVQNNLNECQYESQTSNDTTLNFLIPFSNQKMLPQLFRAINKYDQSIIIGLSMKTLEDAFVKIGMEDESHNEQNYDVKVVSIPDCLKRDPVYDYKQQILALFLRRLFTTIRTNTNYIAIFIPMLTFVLGVSICAKVDFKKLLEDIKDIGDNLEVVIEFFQISLMSSTLVLSYCFNSTVYIVLPVLEKEYYLKQALTGMGCRLMPYWLGTFLFDLIIYFSLVILFMGLSAALGLDIVFDFFWEGLASVVCFGPTYILHAYVMGFVFKKLESALKMYAIYSFFVGFCMPFLVLGMMTYFYDSFGKPQWIEVSIYVVQMIFCVLSPFYAFFEAYTMINGKFNDLKDIYGAPQYITDTYVFCYIMIGQTFAQIIILWMIESKNIEFLQRKQQEQSIYDALSDGVEQDVQQESDRILSNPNDPIKAIQLKKSYIKGTEILQQPTFGIKKGEIFGLIGPNGAGKSTIINIFTGITQASGGQALIANEKVQNQVMNIKQRVGICPQFDCIWENLTSQEHLYLFGRIKGLKGQDLDDAVNYFMNNMALNLFKQKKAGELSGGNKRKLCVADALIGGSDLTFFDEPSTGVDPISRRFLFQTLKRNVQLRNCSTLLTTHTIEEAESLSQRIGIIIAGKFMCLGTPEYLRKKYGTGYQVTVKINDNPEQVIDIVNKHFDCQQVEDKRQNYLTFALPQNLIFYQTFEIFQQYINDGIILDFQINESSLEQIFILFSKAQQEINEKQGVLID